MKAKKAKRREIVRQRIVDLHAHYTPEGPARESRLSFLSFQQEAGDWSLKLRKRELRKRQANLSKLTKAFQATAPLFGDLLQGKLPVESCVEQIKSIVPDKTTRLEVFDIWKGNAIRADLAESKKSSVQDHAEFELSVKVLKAWEAIVDGVAVLVEAAGHGHLKAAQMLVDSTIYANMLVQLVEGKQPKLLRQIAKQRVAWPVLARDEAGWEKKVSTRIAELELGAGSTLFKAPFRSPRGADANRPARLWAKAAVRTIEETCFRLSAFYQILKELGSVEALADFCSKAGWAFADDPKWQKDAAKLKSFSKRSFHEWKVVIRKMIREQIPDFHTRSEWASQRNSAELNGRGTVGEVQNAILDDIISALERLAPA